MPLFDPEKDNRATQSFAKQPPQRLTLRTPKEILAMNFPETDTIWKNRYLSKGERAAWCGMGGIGKSRMVLQFAVCTRLGRDFLKWPTDGMELRWLFLQTENGCRRLQADLRAMLAALTEAEVDLVSDGIKYHTLEAESDGMVWLDKPETYRAVESAIVESLADIVVFDPLRDFTTGNLNDDKDMSEVLSQLGGVVKKGNPQRTPLVIHHAGTGKAGIIKATGHDRSSFGRNSKVLFGWTRSQINMAPALPDANDVLVIASGKNNNGEEFQAFAVRLDEESMMYGVDESFDITEWEGRVNGGSTQKLAVETLVEMVRSAEGAKLEKAMARTKLQNLGATKRSAEELLKEALKGPLLEMKEKRSGKRDSVCLALR